MAIEYFNETAQGVQRSGTAPVRGGEEGHAAGGPIVSFIPADPANSDWVAYQAWLAAGNTPAALPLQQVKDQRIFELRQQWGHYALIGIIAQGFTWGSDAWPSQMINIGNTFVAGDLLTGDGKLHIFDLTGVERALTMTAASKVCAGLYQFYLLTEREYRAKVAEVNACTTDAQVKAVVWTPVYTTAARFNADTYVHPAQEEEAPAQS